MDKNHITNNINPLLHTVDYVVCEKPQAIIASF